MNKIKLNQDKLLGFKTLPRSSKPGVKLGVKLGAKVGGKGPPP